MVVDIPFIKMHGLGNDFVIIDARTQNINFTPQQVAVIANRSSGIGCDQLIILRQPKTAGSDVYMEIYNNDGGKVSACGNATRCVAWLCMQEKGAQHAVIETAAGQLPASVAGDRLVTVNMGPPKLNMHVVPVVLDGLPAPVIVDIGNPHAVFFVDDAEAVDVAHYGPLAENESLFPYRTNAEFAHVTPEGNIRMRVWERGVGITQACGTGACATLVAAVNQGRAARKADIIFDGGHLTVEWRDDGDVMMTGQVATVFKGTFRPDFLGF